MCVRAPAASAATFGVYFATLNVYEERGKSMRIAGDEMGGWATVEMRHGN